MSENTDSERRWLNSHLCQKKGDLLERGGGGGGLKKGFTINQSQHAINTIDKWELGAASISTRGLDSSTVSRLSSNS